MFDAAKEKYENRNQYALLVSNARQKVEDMKPWKTRVEQLTVQVKVFSDITDYSPDAHKVGTEWSQAYAILQVGVYSTPHSPSTMYLA